MTQPKTLRRPLHGCVLYVKALPKQQIHFFKILQQPHSVCWHMNANGVTKQSRYVVWSLYFKTELQHVKENWKDHLTKV